MHPFHRTSRVGTYLVKIMINSFVIGPTGKSAFPFAIAKNIVYEYTGNILGQWQSIVKINESKKDWPSCETVANVALFVSTLVSN